MRTLKSLSIVFSVGFFFQVPKQQLYVNPSVIFDIYYTDELGVDSINNIGPYKEIKGMLMQYRLKKLGLEMCFTATSVKKEDIKDDDFEVPAFYKIVTRKEMEKLFDDIQKQFLNFSQKTSFTDGYDFIRLKK